MARMRVIAARLHNFRRFSDLSLINIPPSAKVVLVVGPNGCGKSSLFDAFIHWYRSRSGVGINTDAAYFRKGEKSDFDWTQTVQIDLADGRQPEKGCLYVRSAYRNDPDFNVRNITQQAPPSEEVRIGRSIDNDQTVGANYQRLVYETMAAVYDEGNDQKSVQAIREELIGGVRRSMEAVFGDLVLNNISDPLGGGAFYFKKGAVDSYHYKNLSGGEKAAFDLLLDVHIKKRFYQEAIYCIDELDTHLHTRVQGRLLKELVSVLPDDCQLWVTTHSLGVLRAAQELSQGAPGTVALFDFDEVDPDAAETLVPSSLDRVAWGKMLSIALDDLSDLVIPKYVVVCEGSSVGTRRKDFDAEVYNRILSQVSGDVVFVSGGSSNQVASSAFSISGILRGVARGAKVVALRDRDDMSPNEVSEYEQKGGLVLPRRNLESYLFDDEVLLALRDSANQPNVDVLAIKAGALANCVARGKPNDDLKSASGEIFDQLRRQLQLTQCGNDADAFMRDTLAPLIRSDMAVFREIRGATFDRI